MNDKQNHVDAQHHPSQTASTQPVKPIQNKQLSPSLPQGEHPHWLNGLKGSVYLSELVEERSRLLLCLVGYGLLLLAAFDYIHIIIPLRFTDPLWEFQTIGALVERAAIPLLGLMFVFYRHQGYIGKLEKNILGFLSWISLLVGLLYLLMVPLGIADTWRIYNANEAQISAQLSQQRQQFEQLKGQLNQATTDEKLEQLIGSLTPGGRSPQIKNPEAFKDQLLAKISQAQQSIQVHADTVEATNTQALLKNSVKWNLGALVSGTLFILIWHLTNWARRRQ